MYAGVAGERDEAHYWYAAGQQRRRPREQTEDRHYLEEFDISSESEVVHVGWYVDTSEINYRIRSQNEAQWATTAVVLMQKMEDKYWNE